MGLRQIKISITIDERFKAIVLDNGDLIIEQTKYQHPHHYSPDIVLTTIEEQIELRSQSIQKLHLVRELLMLKTRMIEPQANVKPRPLVRAEAATMQLAEMAAGARRRMELASTAFYRSTTEYFCSCADCDKVDHLILSQWGNLKTGDYVCVECEMNREYEYGFTPYE
jgi:hypothetical protein